MIGAEPREVLVCTRGEPVDPDLMVMLLFMGGFVWAPLAVMGLTINIKRRHDRLVREKRG